MYVKKPVIENVYDSKILLAISTNELVVREISRITGTHKPTIRRQIKEDLLKAYLHEEKGLGKKGKPDKRGKTKYSIKWNKISEDFLSYLRRLSKDRKLSKKEIEEIEIKIKPMNDNKYLILILQIMFKEFSKIYLPHNLPITLKELFNETIVGLGKNLNADVIKPKLYMGLKEEKQFSDFLIFNSLLEKYFSSMKINIAELFYSELEEKSTHEPL